MSTEVSQMWAYVSQMWNPQLSKLRFVHKFQGLQIINP